MFNRRKIHLKATALFISLCLVAPDSGWSMPLPQMSRLMPSSGILQTTGFIHNLPSELAEVITVSSRQKNSLPSVIYIQDAHAHAGAQRGIKNILDLLHGEAQKNNKEFLVAVEGASGQLHPEYFDFKTDGFAVGDAVVESLLNKGELTGSELFAWNEYKKNSAMVPAVLGVEDPKLYRENLKYYFRNKSKKDSVLELLLDVRLTLRTETSKVFNKTLLSLYEYRTKWKQGQWGNEINLSRADLSKYVDALVAGAREHAGIDLRNSVEQLRFPNLIRMYKLTRSELKRDQSLLSDQYAQVSRTIKRLADSGKIESALSSWAYDQGIETQMPVNYQQETRVRHLLESLIFVSRTTDFSLEDNSEFMEVLKASVLQSEIEADQLLEEMNRLESTLFDSLFKDEQERALFNKLEQLDQIRQLMDLKVVPETFESLLIKGWDAFEWVEEYLGEAELRVLRTGVSNAFNFYRTAHERDEVLVSNTLDLISRKNDSDAMVVLIAGGFHSRGIQNELNEANVEFAVLQPRLTFTASDDLYDKVMSHEHADLSQYFQVRNPFATHQTALLYRTLLEVGPAALLKQDELSSSTVKESFAALKASNVLLKDVSSHNALVKALVSAAAGFHGFVEGRSAEDAAEQIIAGLRYELRSEEQGISEQQFANKIQRYMANLQAQRESRDGLDQVSVLSGYPRARYDRDTLLVLTELIGVFMRDPEKAWEARAFLKNYNNASLITNYLLPALHKRMDEDEGPLDPGFRERMAAKGQEALFVVIDAIKDSNAYSILRPLPDENLPFAIHFDNTKLEDYFVKLGALPAPLPGEVPVTDIWFTHDPNSIIGFVGAYKHKSMAPHAKGGIRYMSPLNRRAEYTPREFYNKVYGDPTYTHKTQTGVIVDLSDLVRSQDPKNILGTEFQGAKGEFSFYTGLTVEEAFKKFAALFIDAGILSHEVPGPDIGMSGDLVQAGVNEAKRVLYRHLNRELEYLDLLVNAKSYSQKELNYLQISPENLTELRQAYRARFGENKNPLLVYEDALKLVEEYSQNIRFRRDRVFRFIRTEMVRDSFGSRLLLPIQVFNTTEELVDEFYGTVIPRSIDQDPEVSSKVFSAAYKPESSSAFKKTVNKILGAVITGGLGSEGAIDHVISAITAKGVVVAYRRVKDYLIKSEKLQKKQKVKVGVNGAGDVGGSAALMIARGGDTVVMMQDVNGAVFRPTGFTVAELQAFNNIPPNDRNVITFFTQFENVQAFQGMAEGAAELFSGSPDYGIDVIVTAAIANTINESNVGQITDSKSTIKAIIEGGNNTYKRVAEKIAESDVVAVTGATANIGGVMASSDENQIKHKKTVQEITRPTIQNTEPKGNKVTGTLHGHIEEVVLSHVGPRGGVKRGKIILHDGRVSKSHSAFPDLPENTIVDLARSEDGQLKAFVNNYYVGDVDEAELVQKLLFKVGDSRQSITVVGGKVKETNAAIPEIRRGPVDVVFPIRERKRATYVRVNETIYAFQTVVLALMEPGNKKRDAVHVQQAISKMLTDKKAQIYSSPAYLNQRVRAIRQLRAEGYQATPEELLHIVSADLARKELLNISYKDPQKHQDNNQIEWIETVNPFTQERIRVSADFEITVLEDDLAQYREWPVRRLFHDIGAVMNIYKALYEEYKQTPDNFQNKFFAEQFQMILSQYDAAERAVKEGVEDNALREMVKLFQLGYAFLNSSEHLPSLEQFNVSNAAKSIAAIAVRNVEVNRNFFASWLGLEEPLRKTLDVNMFAEDMVKSFLSGATEAFLNFDRTNDLKIESYPVALSRVFRNLMVNALHATDADQIDRERRIEVKTEYLNPVDEGSAGSVAIHIIDNGTGMDEETLQRIFEPYFTTKPDGKGTGLGLVNVKSLVEEVLGGTIKVSTEPGLGSTFTVVLPVQAPIRNELRSDEKAENLLQGMNEDERAALQKHFENRETYQQLVEFLRFENPTPLVRSNKKVMAEFLLFQNIFNKADFYIHYGKIGEPWTTQKVEPRAEGSMPYENRTRYAVEFDLPVDQPGEYGVTFYAKPKGTEDSDFFVWQSSNEEDAGKLILDEAGRTDSFRFLQAPKGVSYANIGHAEVAFDLDPRSIDLLEFTARVQKYDDPGFQYDIEINPEQIRSQSGGGYVLSVDVDPVELSDYRVDFYVRTKSGDIVFESDPDYPAMVSIYKTAAEVKQLHESFTNIDTFSDYLTGLVRETSISEVSSFVFDATKNNEELRNLVSGYFVEEVIKRLSDAEMSAADRDKWTSIYKVLNTLGIGRDVTFVTPEGPHAIGGGLGAVIRGLPNSLAKAGVPITVITNLYEEKLKNKHESAEDVLKDGLEINGKNVKPVQIGTVDIPYGPVYYAGTKNIETPGYTLEAKVYLAEHNGVRFIFLRHPEMTNRLYPKVASSEELKRAIFLARGALEVARKKFTYGDNQILDLQPSMMFSHDWVAGLIPFFAVADETYQKDLTIKKMRTGHFIHNFNSAYQGRVYANQDGFKDLYGLFNVDAKHYFGLMDPNDRNFINVTASSLFHANTGLWSPSAPFAQEIVTAEGGQGLHYHLRSKVNRLVGISNGIELQEVRRTIWQKAMIAERLVQYDLAQNLKDLERSERIERLKAYKKAIQPGEQAGVAKTPDDPRVLNDENFLAALPAWKKAAVKAAQIEYGLREDDDAILFSFIGRVAEQKGLQLLAQKDKSGLTYLEQILLKYPKAQFIFGGPPAEGDIEAAEFVELIKSLEYKFPGHVRGRFEMVPTDEALGIMFASHYFLMPSKYEPGGITQLEAMAGGTIVVGRRTGGIAATIFDYDLDQERGNGFLFDDFTGAKFQNAISNAIDALIAEPSLRVELVRRAAQAKNDWSDRVPQYMAFFQDSMNVLSYDYPHFRRVKRTLNQIKAARSEQRTRDTEPLRPDDDDEMDFVLNESATGGEDIDIDAHSLLTTEIEDAFEGLMGKTSASFLAAFESDVIKLVNGFEAAYPSKDYQITDFFNYLRAPERLNEPTSSFFQFYDGFHRSVRDLFDQPVLGLFLNHPGRFTHVTDPVMIVGYLQRVAGVSEEEALTFSVRDFYYRILNFAAGAIDGRAVTLRGAAKAMTADINGGIAAVFKEEYGLLRMSGLLNLDAFDHPADFLEKYYFAVNTRSEQRVDALQKEVEDALFIKDVARARVSEMSRFNREMIQLFDERRVHKAAGDEEKIAAVEETIREYRDDLVRYADRLHPEREEDRPAETARYDQLDAIQSDESLDNIQKATAFQRSIRETVDREVRRLDRLFKRADAEKNIEEAMSLHFQLLSLFRVKAKAQLLRAINLLGKPVIVENEILTILVGLSTTYRHMEELYDWRWKQALRSLATLKKVWVVGRESESRVYQYQAFRIIENPDAEREQDRVVVRMRSWVKEDEPVGSSQYVPQVRDSAVGDLEKGGRQQVHALHSLAADYEQIQSRIHMIASIRELYKLFGNEIPDELSSQFAAIYMQILDATPGGLRRGRVVQKRDAAADIDTARQRFKSGAINEGIQLLQSAEKALDERLDVIASERTALQARVEHFTHRLRRSDTYRAMNELESLIAGREWGSAMNLLNVLLPLHYHVTAIHNDQYRSLKIRVSWLRDRFEKLNRYAEVESIEQTYKDHLLGEAEEFIRQIKLMTIPGRSELRSDPDEKDKPAIQIADTGSVGTNTRAYYKNFTHHRISNATDAGRYIALSYNYENESFEIETGSNAKPVDLTLRKRLENLEKNARFKAFIESMRESVLDDGRSLLKIYLLERSENQRYSRHPHLLTAVGSDFNVAFSGTNGGKEQAVYLTRDAFTDLDTRLVIDVLQNQIQLAIARLDDWRNDRPLNFIQFNPSMHTFMKRVRGNKAIKAELDAVRKFDIQIGHDYFIDSNLSAVILAQFKLIAEELMPEYAAAQTLYKRARSFNEAVKNYDFKNAVKLWGLITYELKEVAASSGQFAQAKAFTETNPYRFLKTVSEGVTDILKQYVVQYGLANEEGQEHGMVVGRVIVVDDINEVGAKFDEVHQERASGKKEDIIWVLPYLPVAYDEIPGEGIVISVAGNRHAIDTAKEESIPLAIIPNATQLLSAYSGKKATFRVDEDREVRFRLAHEGETSIPRPKEKGKINVPKARIDGKLAYKLSEVDENFVNFVGPKAATLGHLMAAGLNVPQGYALSFRFWHEFFEHNNKSDNPLSGEIDELWQTLELVDSDGGKRFVTPNDEVQRVLASIREVIRRAEFPRHLLEELAAIQSDLLGREITVEELEENHQDFLGHVKAVFSAKYNMAPVKARLRHKIEDADVYPAVIIQSPIHAKFAGTLYTADDVSFDRNRVTAMASHGQGAAVVGEQGHAAEVHVNKLTSNTEIPYPRSFIDAKYELLHTDFSYVRSTFNFEDLLQLRTAGFYDSYPDRSDVDNPNSPMRIVAASADERDTKIFTGDLPQRLSKLGQFVEELFMYFPQDVEWALDADDQIWLVQSRYQKTEKLPTEAMIFAETDERLGHVAADVLHDIKQAAAALDLKELQKYLQFDTEDPMKVLKNKELHAQRIAAVRLLSLIGKQEEKLKKIDRKALLALTAFIAETIHNETSVVLIDALNSSALLEFLRDATRFLNDENLNDQVRRLFEMLGGMQTAHFTHLNGFAIAKGLVLFGEYDVAVKKIKDSFSTAKQDAGVADRGLRLLAEIPMEHSRALIEQYAHSKDMPDWVNYFALKLIARGDKEIETSAQTRQELRSQDNALTTTADFNQELMRAALQPFEIIADSFNDVHSIVTGGADASEGLFSVELIADYFSDEIVSITYGGSERRVSASEAAGLWVEHEVGRRSYAEQAGIDNPELQALINNIKLISVDPDRAFNLGADIHLQLEGRPDNLNIFIPALALIADLGGSLNLNMQGMSESEANELEDAVFALLKEKQVRLEKNQFKVIGVGAAKRFVSFSGSDLRAGERHALLGVEEEVSRVNYRSGVNLFKLGSDALENEELLSATLVTVIHAMALDKNLEDYYSLLNPREMFPDAFSQILSYVSTFLETQRSLATSA